MYTELKCIVCETNHFDALFEAREISGHVLARCEECGMVLALSVHGQPEVSYSEYGDYLITDSTQIFRRVRAMERRCSNWLGILRKESPFPRILDFGSGAGYFCKAMQNLGIEAYGVEVSQKLVSYCREKVGASNIYEGLDAATDHPFDAVFMHDVIEHLSPQQILGITRDIVRALRPGGLLIGNTPNFASLNIRLCKDRDPVIAPPSHLCYFTPATLDRYLAKFGMKRVMLSTKGLSSNSFLRKGKFQRSFLENSARDTAILRLPVWLALRGGFLLFGALARVMNAGYQIHFIYRKQGAVHPLVQPWLKG